MCATVKTFHIYASTGIFRLVCELNRRRRKKNTKLLPGIFTIEILRHTIIIRFQVKTETNATTTTELPMSIEK